LLNAKVSCVDQSIQQSVYVTVHSTEGVKKLSGKYCIVTVPTAHLSSLTFNPPLPISLTYLCSRTKMPSLIKCVVCYNKAFWRDKGLSGEILSDSFPLCFSFDNCDRIPTIVCFITGVRAATASKLSKEDRRSSVIQHLSVLFGKEAENVENYDEKDWGVDGGAYFGIPTPKAFLNADLQCLQISHLQVYFAGSERASEWVGYVDGALQSAEMIVNKIVEL